MLSSLLDMKCKHGIGCCVRQLADQGSVFMAAGHVY